MVQCCTFSSPTFVLFREKMSNSKPYTRPFPQNVKTNILSPTVGLLYIRTWRFEKLQPSGGRINIKMSSYQYKKSHCGDKTILRPSYLHNGIYYTGKMTYLYWIRAQETTTAAGGTKFTWACRYSSLTAKLIVVQESNRMLKEVMGLI